jgi:DNA polymerase-3 subunit gamma/tau
VEELVKHIKEIAAVENIKFENERLITELAVLGNGSVRDTLSLLDQVLTFSEGNFISEASFATSLGVAGPSVIKSIVDSILIGNEKEVQKVFHQLMKENIPLKNFVSSVSDQIFLELQTNKEFSKAELIWVFESLARETVWIFNSISPEKTVEVLLLKLTKRREFFGSAKKNSEKIEVQPEINEVKIEAIPVEPKEEISEPEIIQMPDNVVLDQGWDGFLNFLNDKSPASASNLEQGNLTKPIKLTNDSLHIELGFSFSGLVFLDYLQEPEVYQKLLNNLSEYFRIKKENIRIDLIEVKDEQDFVSKAEIKRMEAEITEQDKIQAFKNNPILKEAEKIFNSKVDKVILDTNKK